MAAEKPRVILEIIEGGRGDGGGPPAGPPPAPPEDGPGVSAIFGSHIQLKEALLSRLGADWKHAAGQWYGWDGMRWRRDEVKATWRIATKTCKEEGAYCEDAKLARGIMSRPSVYAALDLASSDEQVACAMSEFDRDPWLLNTPDGVVDLKTGQLHPHDRAYAMTKLAAAGPMSGGDSGIGGCPTFLAYLDSATGGDDALKHYLQRVAGYCLTGSIEEHCILFFHGPGGTGKTLFLLLIQDLLGDYAINAPMNAFTVTTGERHPTEMARMVGARVVTASEVDEGVRWDEGKLKAISGGDKITAHFMRQDDFTFEPQFKLLLAGNHRPRMRSADDAMRRRMQVIPFKTKPKTPDKGLREKLRSELPGILRWAVQGELERRKIGGLNPPRAVQAATDDYFQAENTLGRWLDERCECDANYWTETRELYRDFQEWAKGVGEYIIAERIFAQKLEQMPSIQRALHPRTRRSGFRGLRPLRMTSDLFDAGTGGITVKREPSRANELPLGAPQDPGDEYER